MQVLVEYRSNSRALLSLHAKYEGVYVAEFYPHLHIVLLANDYGEGLWPIAREQSPACFAPAQPGSSESLLTAAVARTKPYTEHPLHIITNENMSKLLYGELRAHAGLSPDDFEFVCPPADRGTAFSIALICACLRRDDPDAIVAVLDVDQRIETDERWPHLLYAAYQTALQDKIVLIGARQPEKINGTSYIRAGQKIDNVDGTFEVRVFSVDPRPPAATRAYHEGAYWYTGIFAGRAATILGSLANPALKGRHATRDIESLHRIAETASFFAMIDRDSWRLPDADKIASTLLESSIEKAAFEHSSNLVLMTTTIQFASNATLRDIDSNTSADEQSNRLVGNALAVESSGVTVLAQDPQRFIAAYGLDDVAVVDTPDALLVARKSQLKSTDKLLERMREEGVEQIATSAQRPFAWGTATLLTRGANYVTWRVELPAGSTLDALTIPLEYEAFDAKAARGLREQYVVAAGDVIVKGREKNAQATLVGTGSAFESNTKEPIVIMCVEENPAVLILTATV